MNSICDGDRQAAGEVGEEDDGALEHAHQDQVLGSVLVFLRHLVGHFLDAGLQCLLVDKHCLDVVAVAVSRNVEILGIMHGC